MKARTHRRSMPTGRFGAFRPAEDVGRSDYVRIANRRSARAARKAEAQWRRTLPEGVTV